MRRLEWDPAWQRFSAFEYGLTGVAGAVYLTSLLIGPNRKSPYRGRTGFDQSTRELLRADNLATRELVSDVSDVMVGVQMAYPFVADSLLNASFYRRSPDVAQQLFLINAEVVAITAALNGVTKIVVSRERPLGVDCEDPEQASDYCADHRRYIGFYSGHTTFAFAAASSTCAQHQYLPLYGPGSSWVPCVAGYSLATTTGVLRMVADRHYLSDVIVGAVVGTSVGLLVPLMHFDDADPSEVASSKESVFTRYRMTVGLAPSGLQLNGAF